MGAQLYELVESQRQGQSFMHQGNGANIALEDIGAIAPGLSQHQVATQHKTANLVGMIAIDGNAGKRSAVMPMEEFFD